MPHSEHERAELVYLCTVGIRIEPSLSRTESAIRLAGGVRPPVSRNRWQPSRDRVNKRVSA